MFNLGFSELLLLGVIALIFIGPEQLPQVARTVGRLLNEWKRASSEFQSTFTSTVTDDFQQRWQESRQKIENGQIEPSDSPVALLDSHNAESQPPSSDSDSASMLTSADQEASNEHLGSSDLHAEADVSDLPVQPDPGKKS